jgi:hypothetical protein
MNKLKHTRGPWKKIYNKANPEKYSDYHVISKHNIVAVGINSESDANLLSAAPEMLECLISLYKTLSSFGSNISKCGSKEIIEKATGLKIEELL